MKVCAYLSVLTLIFFAESTVAEIVHDPEFVRMEKEFSAQWVADDREVRAKLAALEQRRFVAVKFCR